MDRFGDRGLLLANIEGLLAFNKEHKDMKTGHDSLFGDMGGEAFPLRLDEAPDATLTEKLNWEKDLLGLYVSGHPLDTCTIEMKRIEMDIKQVKEHMKEGMLATIYGVISTLKPFMTKKNDTMYFVQISDRSGGIEGVVFPKNAEQHKELLVPDMKIAIQGRLNMRKGSMTIVIERMRALKDDAQMAAVEAAKATATTPSSTPASPA